MLTSNPSKWKDFPGVWGLLALKSKARDSLLRSTTFGWPMYDLRYYFSNREAQKLYRQQRNDFPLTGLQERIVGELRERGISVIHVTALFSEKVFTRIQESDLGT